MGFLAPWMLFGTAAVSVPIIIHLFFKSRYRTVPWAAMKFLLTSIEQTSKRLRFQELLLLALRCLLLAALAFAMARPMMSVARGTGRGDAVDAVFVIDTSYSMSASDGAQARLDRVKAAATEVIDKLPPHSAVHIIGASDRATLLGPRSPSDLEQGRRIVQGLELTSLASDIAPALVEARKTLETGQLPNKEFYLFSDMQKLGWEEQAASVKKAFKEVKDTAAVFLVRAGKRLPKNAAIIGITPQAGVPRPGERVGFAVLIHNTGDEELQDVVVSLTSDPSIKGEDKERTDTQTVPTLKVGETRTVTLSAKFEKSGPRALTARIKHDDVPSDNRYDQVIPVRDAVNVLVVNGGGNDRDAAKSSTFFLNHALLPIKDSERGKYFLQLREVEPRLASPALLTKTDLVFLVNVGVPDGKRTDGLRRVHLPTDFVAELGNWVRQGKSLIIIPGDNSQPDAFNKGLGDLLPTPIHQVREYIPKQAPFFDRGTFTLPAFVKFKDDGYFAGFSKIQSPKILELAEPKAESAAEAILRFDTGLPALVRKRIDKGEVILFATAADPLWSDLPLSFGEFIPLIQTMFAHLLQGQTQDLNTVAGRSLTWHPTDKELRNYSLQTPTGEFLRLGLPAVKDKRQVLTLPELAQAGIYRLVARSATQDETVAETGIPIAVTPDLRESQDFTALTDEQIDTRLGFSPVHLSAGSDETSGMDRFQKEWTLWALLAVLVLLVCEALLAWACGRAW
jgi:hypothetical protein